jgi:hypothetical protein
MEDICVQSSTTVDELRQMITSELIRLGKLPLDASPNRIRIRDRYSLNPGKILRNGKTMNDLHIYLCDNKSLCIEILDKEEDLLDNEHGDVIVLLSRWNRSKWLLEKRDEVLLPGNYTVRDVAKGLSMLYSIPLDNLRVLVVPKENVFYLSDLVLKSPRSNYGRSWFDPSNETKLMRYMSHDLRVQDGDLVIIQDITEPLMELSLADLKSIEIVEAVNNNNSSSYSSYFTPGVGGSAYQEGYYGCYPTYNAASVATVNDYSRYGTNVSSAGGSSAVSVGTSPISNHYPYSGPGTGTATPVASYSSTSRSQGVKIKTHKERLKEQNKSSTSLNMSSSSSTSNFNSNQNSSVALDLLISPTSEVTNESDLQAIHNHILEINNEENGNSSEIRNNSPANPLDGTNSNTDELFDKISNPNNHDVAEFFHQGGVDEFDFLR